MPPTQQSLPGIKKAAVLLVQLGTDKASKILANLRESEVEEITAEIARLQSVEGAMADQVVEEFRHLLEARKFVGQGGVSYAQELLEAGLGHEKAAEIMERLAAAMVEMPFQYLRRADPRQVLSFLQEEHPQTIALVLSHMSSQSAAIVLSGLAPELQADVAHRVATMERTNPEVIRQVDAAFERKLSSVLQPADLSTVGGLRPLVEIINHSDRATERLILEGLERKDPSLAEEIRSQMFVFEDIATLDDRSVQLVVRQVEMSDLAIALKGVSQGVREVLLRNMSERAAQNLVEEMEVLGAQRLKVVEEAQAKIVHVVRSLEEAGQIIVSRGADDEFVA